ncbi:MAG: uroporphyrinogen-III synthase [Deltaproteobacteria bacterium]|nr:uroporphyrinogen-III synthase [Deltaproteobacteria bacterium]MBW2253609.1 uroporphyrinogen-III synthase [Deltaproteobacteria bacterium]
MRRVLVTRSAETAGALSEPLRSAGFEPVEVPLIRLEPVPGAVAAAAAERRFDGLVLTSAAAAEASAGVVAEGWPPPLVAAVGRATASRARAVGLPVSLVPPRATGLDLGAALGALPGQVLLYPRAAEVTPGTVERLRATGAEVVEVVAYRNVAPEGLPEHLAAAWPVDAVTLLSGSAARRMAEATRAAGITVDIPVVVIGPSTAEVAREVGLAVSAIAEPHSVEGVVRGVVRCLGA